MEGYELDDDEIDRRLKELKSTTSGPQDLKLKAGRPKLSKEPLKNISFKCTQGLSDLIDEACKKTGMQKSAFIRKAAYIAAFKALEKD